MKAIKSRKRPHANRHVMGTTLAALLLPLAAQADNVAPPPDDARPAATVAVVGQADTGFRAEYASSAKYTEKLVDTAQTVQVSRRNCSSSRAP